MPEITTMTEDGEAEYGPQGMESPSTRAELFEVLDVLVAVIQQLQARIATIEERGAS